MVHDILKVLGKQTNLLTKNSLIYETILKYEREMKTFKLKAEEVNPQ